MRILLWAALWAALEANAAFAQTAAAPPTNKPKLPFDILSTYPDPAPSGKPRLLFTLPHELDWRDILSAYSPNLDFDHIPKAQFDRLPKQPIFLEDETPAFDLCRIVPLPLNLQSSSYTYASEYGLDPLQISGMRVCATFRDEPQEEYAAVAYYGTIVSPLPTKRPRALAGFVLRTPKNLAATPLPREGRQFTAVVSAAGKSHERQLTYIFTEPGATPVRLVREAGSYGQLLRWNSFQVDGKTYLLEISRRADQTTCPYSVTLWQAGPTLTPLASGGDSCDP